MLGHSECHHRGERCRESWLSRHVPRVQWARCDSEDLYDVFIPASRCSIGLPAVLGAHCTISKTTLTNHHAFRSHVYQPKRSRHLFRANVLLILVRMPIHPQLSWHTSTTPSAATEPFFLSQLSRRQNLNFLDRLSALEVAPCSITCGVDIVSLRWVEGTSVVGEGL